MKYKLTDEKIEWCCRTLYRIEAVKDFGCVKAGVKGGFVESEKNLSQECDAWVYDDARVCGNARVYGDAEVYGNARVCGNARVYGDAEVYGNARVCGNAEINKNSSILWISGIGSRLGTTTVFTNKDGGVSISCGCFSGNLDEFEKKVDASHGDNKYGKEYKALIELIKIHFEVGNGNQG